MNPVRQAPGRNRTTLKEPLTSVGTNQSGRCEGGTVKRADFLRAATKKVPAEEFRRRKIDVEDIHHHGGGMQSVREDTYRGHKITIRTSYAIEVDEKPIEGHIEVTNGGQVHYHALPNYTFDSAMDLVKKLIAAAPEDFTDGATPLPHGHPHGHGE